MNRLEETSAALYDLLSYQNTSFGQHLRHDIVSGQSGNKIGETRFDPSIHNIASINPIALTSIAFGDEVPYVDVVMPYHGIKLNVIVDDDSGRENSHDWLKPVTDYRRKVGHQIMKALEDSKQPNDSIEMHVIGSPSDPSIYDRQAMIHETNTALQSATRAAEICQTGLSFLISNFAKLPITEGTNYDFKRAIAVKANYPLELNYPGNTGVWSLGGRKSVNTNYPPELAKVNQRLFEWHASIGERLGAKGLQLAKIVYDPNYSDGFNRDAIDKELAKSIKRLS